MAWLAEHLHGGQLSRRVIWTTAAFAERWVNLGCVKPLRCMLFPPRNFLILANETQDGSDTVILRSLLASQHPQRTPQAAPSRIPTELSRVLSSAQALHHCPDFHQVCAAQAGSCLFRMKNSQIHLCRA